MADGESNRLPVTPSKATDINTKPAELRSLRSRNSLLRVDLASLPDDILSQHHFRNKEDDVFSDRKENLDIDGHGCATVLMQRGATVLNRKFELLLVRAILDDYRTLLTLATGRPKRFAQ